MRVSFSLQGQSTSNPEDRDLLAMDEEGCLLLGIPGNPLSTLVFTRIYLRALLSALCGYPQTVIHTAFSVRRSRAGATNRSGFRFA
jgi:molybdopterin biosynthesis enzyme